MPGRRGQLLGGDLGAGSEAGHGSLQGLGQALGAKRLQEVVHGVDLECLQGELVVGRGEDHCRANLGREKLQNLETIDLGHLYVEEEEIRRELPSGDG